MPATTPTGRAAYEAEVKARPTYHDGSPRRTWKQLGDVERWSWQRPVRVANTHRDDNAAYRCDMIDAGRGHLLR